MRKKRNHFKTICFTGMISLFLGLSLAGECQHISLPLHSPRLQVLHVDKIPKIDGDVSFLRKGPWVPVLGKNDEGEPSTIAFWYESRWSNEGLYIAAVIPQADLRNLLSTGRTPDAPFMINMNIDVQPEPVPGTRGNYRLQFIPLIEAPSKMLFESPAFKFNHYLGSGSRLNDPGLVAWHELSLSHIQPEGIRTRWDRYGTKGKGLSFEAFVPWANLGLSGKPPHNIFFDIQTELPGQSPAGWASDVRKVRKSGGRMTLLEPGKIINDDLYESDTVVMQSPGDMITQHRPLTVTLPMPDSSSTDPQFTLVDKEGTPVQHLKTRLSSKSEDVLYARIIVPDIPDGQYSLQLKDGKSKKVITWKPLYMADILANEKLIKPRHQLYGRLNRTRKMGRSTWQEGYRAKVNWLLEHVETNPLSIESVNQSLDRLKDAEKILNDLDRNKRPAPANVNYYRPGGFVADGQRGFVRFIPGKGKARLTINADKKTSWQVSPLIYGTFSEPVVYDRPIYGMLYAQQLRNTSLEWGHPTFSETMDQYVNRYHEIDTESARQVRSGAWVPVQSTDENKVAAPWIGIGSGDAVFSLSSDAFNSKTSQKISHHGDAGEAGIAQLISLPVWRESTYHFKGYFRGDGAVHSAQIKLYYKGNVIDQALLRDIGDRWKAFEATLKTPIKHEMQNGFLLSITFQDSGLLYADQLTLFPADSIGGADPQVVDRLKRMDPAWIRWPGGNYASAYHWKKGVGPFKDRGASPNPSWPGLTSHLFGTDEYMRLTDKVNLEPLITVNAGDGNPEEAADWVEYANGSSSTPMGAWRVRNGHRDPYDIKYWNIGNELWGSWQVGYCTPYDYVQRYRAFTNAMEKKDPDLTYIAIGVGPFSLGPRRWTDMMVDSVQNRLDVIDFHAYLGVSPHPGFDDHQTLQTLIDMPMAFEQGLMAFRKEAVEKERKDLKVIVGEYNSSTRNIPAEWRPTAQLLSYAGWLHAFIRQSEYVIGANATEYSIFDPRSEILGTLHPRNELYKLYHQLAGSQPVEAVMETPVRQNPYQFGKDVTPAFNLPVIDAVVLKDQEDESLAISLINRDIQDSREVELNLRGFKVKKDALQFLLWDPVGGKRHTINEQKSTLSADQHFTVSLPPHSVSLIKLFKQPH